VVNPEDNQDMNNGKAVEENHHKSSDKDNSQNSDNENENENKNENKQKEAKDENISNNNDVSNIIVVNPEDNQDMNNGNAVEENHQESSVKNNSQKSENENEQKETKDENISNNNDVNSIIVVNPEGNQDMNNGKAVEENHQESSDKENSQELENVNEQKVTKDENNMNSNKNITDKVDQLITPEKCFHQIIGEFIPLISLFIDQVDSYSGKVPLIELTESYQSIEYRLIEQLNMLDKIETDNIKVREKNIFLVKLIQNLLTQINKKKKELITKKINYINS